MHALARNQDRGSLLIKAVGYLAQIFSSTHHSLDCGDAESPLATHMLVGRLELHVHILLLGFRFCLNHIEVNCKRLRAVDASQIELIGATHAYFSCRCVLAIVFVLDWGCLADDSANLELLGAEDLQVCNKAHFKIVVRINFEELFERLLEDWITK